MRDNNTRLRVTAWPGTPLPLPTTRRCNYHWDEAQTLLQPDLGASVSKVEVTGQTYLEVAALNLDDNQAILAFVSRFGTMGVYDGQSGGWPQLEGLTELQAGDNGLVRLEQARRRAREPLAEELRSYQHLIDTGALSDEALLQAKLLVMSPPHAEDDDTIETRDEFVLAAQLIRDALAAWRAIQEDKRTDEVNFESPIRHVVAESGRARSWARQNLDVVGFLDWFFGKALEPFRPRIHIPWLGPLGSRADRQREGLSVRPSQGLIEAVPLYAACALELYNHVLENVEYKICANETCQKTFVQQEGYPINRRHRLIGTKYHSRKCAQAQAQRQYRRRQREGQNAPGSNP